MNTIEKKISGEVIYDGKVVRLEKDVVLCPNNNEAYREIVRHNGGAAVLCVTNDNKVILVKQFRYAYNEFLYEIPAGKLELNEDPLVAAEREFEEETGNKAQNIEFLNVIYPTCGYCDEKIYLYLVTDFKQTKTNLDEDEFVETYYIDLKDVYKMILNGEIKDAKTICAINSYILKRGGID